MTSTGTVQTTVGSGTTPTIATTKGQVALSLAGVGDERPGQRLHQGELHGPDGTANPSSFTLYWGKAQGTNFQVPMSIVSS